MCKNCKYHNNKDHRNATDRRSEWKQTRNRELPFVGVDGEGANIDDPDTLFGTKHVYLLLRAGNQVLETGNPLTWEDCFNFLCDLPRFGIYVAYFFDYDVTKMIEGLPAERVHRLFNRQLRNPRRGWSPMPVEYGGFQFDYLPHKFFQIKRKEQKHYTVINDVGQFFQSSFLTTLDKWQVGTEDDRAKIQTGKSMRADFSGVDDDIRAYNHLEVQLLAELMEQFRNVCRETGYVPGHWQGPGNLAAAMLKHHNVPRRDAIPILGNEAFKSRANAAYYGGRFETTAAGPIPGPVYQYDINSAYPYQLTKLPCLEHGAWRQVQDRPNRGLWFGQVHFNHIEPNVVCGFPVRRPDGSIFYPYQGNGTYWSPEIEAAERVGAGIDFAGGWVYEDNCDCRWFDFIDGYYQERLRLGKTTKGFVLKLAGNSVYGKIAQSIGFAPYANPVWAGLITAGCRAQILDAVAKAMENPLLDGFFYGEPIYMIATDGIFCAKKLQLPISTKLGEWEETTHDEGIFIVQPGVYFVSDGSVKSRGVARSHIHQRRDDFEETWAANLEARNFERTVSVEVDNFITAKQALARRKWRLAGAWEHTTHDISFDWTTKRNNGPVRFDRRNVFRTHPYHGWPNLESVPYDRVIGGTMQISDFDKHTPYFREHDRMQEQPDWVKPLI